MATLMSMLLAWGLLSPHASAGPALRSAGRGIRPDIIEKIRRDQDRPGQWVPLQIPVPEPTQEIDRRDRIPDRPADSGRRGPIVIDMGGEDDDPPPRPTPNGRPSPEALLAAQEAVRSGNPQQLDALFGEDRRGAVCALGAVATTMDLTPHQVSRIVLLAHNRMIETIPDHQRDSSGARQSFYLDVHLGLAARTDLTAHAVDTVVDSILLLASPAITLNDPPALARKILTVVFQTMGPSRRTLLGALASQTHRAHQETRLIVDALRQAGFALP